MGAASARDVCFRKGSCLQVWRVAVRALSSEVWASLPFPRAPPSLSGKRLLHFINYQTITPAGALSSPPLRQFTTGKILTNVLPCAKIYLCSIHYHDRGPRGQPDGG